MANTNYSIIVVEGEVYATGANGYGQLGLGDTNDRTEFEKVPLEVLVQKVACATNHTVVLDVSGYAWGAGLNSSGQLGLGNDTENKKTFVKISNKQFKDVFAGGDNTFLIDIDGFLWACGANSFNSLGIGGGVQKELVQIGVKKWKYISSYAYNTLAIDIDGYLWGVGYNTYSELGTGDRTILNVLTKIGTKTWVKAEIGERRSVAMDTDGFLHSCGYNLIFSVALGLGNVTNSFTWTKIGAKTYRDFYSGFYHTVAVDNIGDYYVFGNSSHGQLLNNNTTSYSTPTKITTNSIDEITFIGAYHTIFRRGEGYFAAGYNTSGQLGTGDKVVKITVTEIQLAAKVLMYLFALQNNAYTIANGIMQDLGTITTTNTKNLFKSGLETITKEDCILVGQQLGKAKIIKMSV